MNSMLASTFCLIAQFSILSSCNLSDRQGYATSHSVVSDSAKRSFAIKLYSDSYNLNTFVAEYIPVINYHLSYTDSSNFTATYNDTLNNLPVLWRFGIKNKSLIYYGYKFEECELSKDCFDKLFSRSDSLISTFTARYGPPTIKTVNEKNFYANNRFPEYPGAIVKGIWIIDGQQIVVNFSASGEHNMYSYSLDVSRYKPSTSEPN